MHDFDRINRHAVTLRNGKTLYPSIKDIKSLERQNLKAQNSLNPAYRYMYAYKREVVAFQTAYQEAKKIKITETIEANEHDFNADGEPV